MSATPARDAITEVIAEALLIELASIRRDLRVASKLGFTVREAAEVTSIGRDEWYRRIGLPRLHPQHVRTKVLGRKRVIPRAEIERVMAEAE